MRSDGRRGRLAGSRQVALGRRDQRTAAGVCGEGPRTREHGRPFLEPRQHLPRTCDVSEFDDRLDVIGLEAVAGRLALPLRIDDRLSSRVLPVRRRRVAERQRDEAEQPVAEERSLRGRSERGDDLLAGHLRLVEPAEVGIDEPACVERPASCTDDAVRSASAMHSSARRSAATQSPVQQAISASRTSVPCTLVTSPSDCERSRPTS